MQFYNLPCHFYSNHIIILIFHPIFHILSCTATVSSLRLDAVLSAMLHVSRGTAAELIEAGRVEINHLPVEKPHAPVYEQDVFTVRGKGRFRLTALPGKSKKDRSIIEFFQY